MDRFNSRNCDRLPLRPVLLALMLSAAAGLLGPAVASAQPTYRFSLVPVTQSDQRLEQVVRLSEELQEQLARRGSPGFPLEQSSQAFSALHSREPVPASQQDVDVLVAEVKAGNVALALDRPREALEHFLKVRNVMGRALETLNRLNVAADHYVQACMRTINILALEQDLREMAVQTAIECMSNSTDTDFTRGRMHPKVAEVFREASAKIQSNGTAPLLVTSEPAGCNVYLNGRPIAATPFRLDHPVRRTYLVQVECGTLGRVYAAKTGDGERRVSVDVLFDNAVRTSLPVLRLDYATQQEQLARVHAMRISETLGTPEAIIVAASGATRLQLRRVGSLTERTVLLEFPYAQDALRHAVDQLLLTEPATATRIRSAGSSAPALLRNDADAQEVTPIKRASWRLQVGATLAASGAIALVSGYWLHTSRAADGERFRSTLPLQPGYLTRGEAWFDERPAEYAALGIGASLATGGAVLLGSELKPQHHVWLPVTSAVLGAAALAWASFEISQGGPCYRSDSDPRACVLDQQYRDRGVHLLLTAIPLLTFPSVLLARRYLRPARGAVVRVGPSLRAGQFGLDTTVRF